MKYYLHDSNSFQDEKIAELYIRFGYEGLGLYYTLLEKLALQEKPVKSIVLKKQLNIGKRLNKCWSFLEEIELIHSNNGETFSKTLLNFSEKYQIKKEKNRKRISEWRSNQEDIKNVTCNEYVRNTPKVKISKVKESNINTLKDNFNLITGKKIRVIDDKTKRQLNARLKEGFTLDDIYIAIENCKNDKYHIENPKYLTPEFITRSDKLQMYLNSKSKSNYDIDPFKK